MATKNAERQRLHRERKRAEGLTQAVLWVPGALLPELRELEQAFKSGLRVEGIVVRDPATGRVRTLQLRK